MNLQNQNKIINLLTICRKAGKLILGFEPVKESVVDDSAKCVFVSSDISPKTLKETEFICRKKNITVICLGLSMEQLAECFRRKVAVMAVCDEGFAKKLKQLASVD